MKHKRVLRIIAIVLILIVLLILVINIIERVTFNNYIDNSIKYFKDINYDTNISLSIKDDSQTSSVFYNLRKSNPVINQEYRQYVNDKLQNSISNYYISNDKEIVLYTKNNTNWESSNVDKIYTIFSVDYSKLKSKSDNVKYLGKEKINDKKYIKYSIEMKTYDIFNLIYNEDILNEDDTNETTKVYIYIDKELGLIYKLSANIDNLNRSDYEAKKLYYTIKILNENFNNNKSIDLPFKK